MDLFAHWSRRNTKSMLDSFKDECFQYDLLPADNNLAEEASASLGLEVNAPYNTRIINYHWHCHCHQLCLGNWL
jgi:hypothetical protein